MTMGVPNSPRQSLEALIGYTPHHDASSKLVIVMVGLPATGKSYVAKKLTRYLNWLQHKTRVFNVGDRRREAASHVDDTAPPSLSTSDATFFDPTSPANVSLRDQLALKTLDELLEWLLRGGGNVGILDATNSTQARRQLVLGHIRQWQRLPGGEGQGIKVLFLENRCSDETIREANIRLKLSGPDYAGKDPEASLADFRRRVAHYEMAYEPLGAAEEAQGLSFAQMTDAGRKMDTHLIRGYLLSQIAEYLLNFNLARRQIWLSCHGESLDDREGRIGRYSDLSRRGREYAGALAEFIEAQRRRWADEEPISGHNPESSQFCVWTSTWPQALQTGASFPAETYPQTHTKMLDDLNAGAMAGLTRSEVAARHPAEHAARARDRLRYRWPGLGGEGYVDLIVRLRPLIVELERTTDHIVLITHRAVVRVLAAYFLGIEQDGLGEVRLPRESVYCFDVVSLDLSHLLSCLLLKTMNESWLRRRGAAQEPYGISFRSFAYDSGLGAFAQVPNSEIPFIALVNR
ncbi:6-phosphofructo-2-kinase-domain-containing protein [Nemania sp. NC0429]|nr:6-phosphofructo-2-kinase-domain-containing protein [Nemania sp. NC0429]